MIRTFDDRVEYTDDSGKLHRTDGPAVIWNNGNLAWYEYGKLHRVDGPAQIVNGHEHYYYGGNHLNEKEYKLLRRGMKIKKIINR